MDTVMEGIVVFIFIGLAVLSMLAVLWYLFQTVRIMWAYNSLLAIASVFFSPIVHIIFYFMPKDNFDKHEAGLFKKYFLSIGLIALLGVVASVVIPATQVQNSIESIDNGEVEAQENVMVQDSLSDEELARQGDVHAQWRLGQMYYNGEGVRQDYAKAFEWYQKAAAQGNPGSEYYVGVMYYNGEGVRQDYAKAFEWYQKAAAHENSGVAYAQYNLGVMYYNGEGVRQDYAQAKEWVGKACDNGLQIGCDKYIELN